MENLQPVNKLFHFYFDKMKIEDIANKMSCDKVTLYRHRNRLLDILSIRFFGKDVLEINATRPCKKIAIYYRKKDDKIFIGQRSEEMTSLKINAFPSEN